MEREAFVCPFCGAPQEGGLPSGVTQTKCLYCGNTIVLPRRLTGLTQRCPNHPDSLTSAFCTRCGRGFCSRCLYVLKGEGGAVQYLCPQCAGLATIEATPGIYLTICCSALFFVVGLSGIRSSGDSFSMAVICLGFGIFCLVGGILQRRTINNMPTLAGKIREQRGSLDT